MFESIIQQAKITDYDFRQTANPEDRLVHLFSEWIDYYKLKWSIARVLKPASILEIGVRFGYSAAAFLHGHSAAHYVGIDLDTDLYGGKQGAINWANKITQQFSTEFIVADTQKMERFPGNIYDLIHVDGQQDGDSSFRDLELAIQQGRYVLLDGYLWTRQNFFAASDFLIRYADLLDFYGVIPGYAGELLIKVSEEYLKEVNEKEFTRANSSIDIRQTYTNEYYTQDCGGFDAYKRSQGKKLEDPRLQAVAAISSLKRSGSVLDIGCGRGELTYYFARQGFAVTSVDYSENAIELADKCFEGEEHLKANVQFICGDACKLTLSGKHDLAIASDVIEHLGFAEVDALYQKLAQYLKEDGLFIVHTFPNLWYYKYYYNRKRKIAASVGAYLPAQPRSRYELLMHINEQSPRVLKKQLSKYFNNVCLWFGEPQNPGGSLVKNFSIREIAEAPSLFAVASHQQIDQEKLIKILQMLPLPPISCEKIKILVKEHPPIVEVNSRFEIQLEIENYSNFILHSYPPNPIHISYHWMNNKATDYVIFDGERTKIFPCIDELQPGGDCVPTNYKAMVKALPTQGNYILRVTLVQEGVSWFDLTATQLMNDIPVMIVLKK